MESWIINDGSEGVPYVTLTVFLLIETAIISFSWHIHCNLRIYFIFETFLNVFGWLISPSKFIFNNYWFLTFAIIGGHCEIRRGCGTFTRHLWRIHLGYSSIEHAVIFTNNTSSKCYVVANLSKILVFLCKTLMLGLRMRPHAYNDGIGRVSGWDPK